MTIALNDLRFHAKHGMYAEEQTLGNTFTVDCVVQIQPTDELITELHQTVNYHAVFELIKDWMQQPEPLLETVCMNIERSIFGTFPFIRSVSVTIKKLQPPIPGFTGNCAVSWYKEY